ncbi:efflux RND transporter periplasmic adaptor subunit [Microvirga lotononidis]|uniref:RND family efflux transporter, MFP subunit n=1 Tax=Microvirga lotononidis TaxID=864069 RepID=I4Z1J6_9HYPH|nr:efflux RND transporter periplasmic adaptor subunit [Microvirga lotononidis]EIM30088.1 RND family efflux transporter, MFP subunit [Microvirga lotononidis]WQO31871.1 efflux RND transporter periplasmic adaptor subunit [Microvirga lotononidis]
MTAVRWKPLCWRPAALLGLLLPAACNSPQRATAPAPQPAVGVRPAEMRGVNQSFQFVGRIKAVSTVALRARVEGFLEQVAFREGQAIRTGDLLYQIEKVQFQAQVDQAKANLASAEAVVTNAQLQYDRQLSLSERQFTPQSLVDQNKANLDSAKANVLQMKAALTQAEVNLGYTEIRAPIDGLISRTAYTIGNLVNPASGVLATIVSQDPIYVLFPVSVRDLELIREARREEGGSLAKIEIRIRLASGAEYPQRGTWNLTDPQVDQQTDTLIMRATIPNPDGQLIDGQFVTAEIRRRQEEPRLVIPQAALQFDQTGYYALVVDEQHKVQQRRIKTGPNRDADVVITAGLQEGDNVIVDGVQKVQPGQAVQANVLAAEASNQ